MPNNRQNHENSSNRKGRDLETSNRLDEITNLVEKHTRTERHLEQHSDIASPERIEQSEDKQHEREELISNLKDKIINGDSGPTNEIEGLERNIVFSEGYLDHNADHMDKRDKRNLKENLENKKETLDRLE